VTDAPLAPFADGLWLSTAPVRFLGMRLTATMAVLRLADDELLVFSPVALTPERRAAVDALGQVAHLYSPNLFHHLRMAEWVAAYPAAKVHAAPGLVRKRPDLRIDRIHRAASRAPIEAEPAFAGLLDEVAIEGFRLQETVLVHRPTRTLVVADLVHNIGRPQHRWTQVYTRAMGFYDRVALSRMIRWTAFSDRAAARRSLEAVLAQPFEHLVVGHGAPLRGDGRQALARAYDWLL
jgi:hypothetical protein